MSSSTEPAYVRVDRSVTHVAEIRLDRPEALNAVSTTLARQLAAACAAVAADPDVRAVVLSSAVPKAFCEISSTRKRLNPARNSLTQSEPPLPPEKVCPNAACWARMRSRVGSTSI